ncbi:GDCCVxC domain-containing (seleno)protein [Nitrosospira briensis]|nr:GDCCVxC domain-containing (seleno)protein [Nitrosospira briensis]
MPTLESILTCPRCGYAKREAMPTNACLFYYECEECGTLLRPLPGDCCVFCSFGSVKCPPVQMESGCCEQGAPDTA